MGTVEQSVLGVLLTSAIATGAVLGFAGSSPSPPAAHSNAARAGAVLFATRGCTHCHGVDGKGTELGPSLRDLRKRSRPAELEHQIVYGGGAMPAFGDTLDHAQVQDLVTFLRAKTWVAAPPDAETAPVQAKEPAQDHPDHL